MQVIFSHPMRLVLKLSKLCSIGEVYGVPWMIGYSHTL